MDRVGSKKVGEMKESYVILGALKYLCIISKIIFQILFV